MAKKKKKVDWEAKYRKEKKAHKVTKLKYKASTLTYEAMQLRKTGKTWKKIGKKLKVPESSIRLATQKRYKQPFLRGRWSEAKLRTGEIIDSRTMKLIEAKKGAQRGMSYEEYVRETSSK